MKLKNLIIFFIYSPIKTKDNGEVNTSWQYKTKEYLNCQQDFNELDANLSGQFDYETIKLRTDMTMDIKKGDGISFLKLSLDKNEKPSHYVKSIQSIGRTTVYTCVSYHGE